MNIKGIFKDALPTLEKFSPSIAGAIGGYPGIAVSFILPLLAKAFNSDTHNLSDIVANILNDHEAPIKLEALEREHCDWICALTQNANNLCSAEINVKLEWNKKL